MATQGKGVMIAATAHHASGTADVTALILVIAACALAVWAGIGVRNALRRGKQAILREVRQEENSSDDGDGEAA